MASRFLKRTTSRWESFYRLISAAIFTWLHPEVLDQKCRVDHQTLSLPNRVHPGRFSVLVLPGHKTIHWSSLKRIREFYERGGSVIATGQLPSKSAEFGHDQDVVRTIKTLFGSTQSVRWRWPSTLRPASSIPKAAEPSGSSS